MMEEIPVYLFTGFLDAGKTKFIQETLKMSALTTERARFFFSVKKGRRSMSPPRFLGKTSSLRL